MTISDLERIIYDCNVEIDTEDYEVLWQGRNYQIPERFGDCEIIDITTNDNYILIRICAEVAK